MTTRTDSQIKKDVIEQLRWDTRVRETDVGVEVQGGIVTLTGTVDSWAARHAAQESAHHVTGVLDVANEIRVKLPGSRERDDTAIAGAVRQALEWDVLVPQARIQSTVSNGVVTLEGTVDYWTEYEDADRAVRNLEGVREVRNLLEVRPPSVAPTDVRASIMAALERHAERASKHVHVAIVGGDVTLTGAVPSWAERAAVVGAVMGTPGVRHVENLLRVQP
jgi:osmotically-inducible protein OsmY